VQSLEVINVQRLSQRREGQRDSSTVTMHW
jgi:hypothetical protein